MDELGNQLLAAVVAGEAPAVALADWFLDVVPGRSEVDVTAAGLRLRLHWLTSPCWTLTAWRPSGPAAATLFHVTPGDGPALATAIATTVASAC